MLLTPRYQVRYSPPANPRQPVSPRQYESMGERQQEFVRGQAALGMVMMRHRLESAPASAEEHARQALNPLYDRRRQEREDELAGLRGNQLVSKVRGPRPQVAPVPSINVGVPYRTDGRGRTHDQHDAQAVHCSNDLNLLRDHLNLLRDVPVRRPVTLPAGAADSGEKTPKRNAQSGELNNVDMLMIPGGGTANNQQVGHDPESENFKRPVEGSGRAAEHDSRSAYELRLIEMARTRGIPIMGICGGSWRVLESYGGRPRTLPENARSLHTNPRDPWTLEHGVTVQKGTMLHGMTATRAQQADANDLQIQDVNSTHWATAATDEWDELEQRDQQPGAPNPNDRLQISATSSGHRQVGGDPATRRPTGSTVEAFESRHGAPVLGVQWHPEGYLPGMPGQDTGQGGANEASRRLFASMTQAAATVARRRQVNEELLSLPRVPGRSRSAPPAL